MAEHGTSTRYRRGCRCDKCAAAHLLEIKLIRLKKESESLDVCVDAKRARERLLKLKEYGYTNRELKMFGVDDCTLTRIVSGRAKMIRKSTESKILSIKTRKIQNKQLIDIAPARRLMRFWRSNGLSYAQIAKACELSPKTLEGICNKKQGKVYAKTYAKMLQHQNDVKSLYMDKHGNSGDDFMSDWEREEAYAAWKNGDTINEIARRYGVTGFVMRKVLRRIDGKKGED